MGNHTVTLRRADRKYANWVSNNPALSLRMNRRVKKEWIEALRSGDYEQGKGRLCGDGGFCCLGVVADLEYDGYWLRDPPTTWMLDDAANSVTRLPPAFAKRIKLVPFVTSLLIILNDGGVPFTKIADWLEGHV